MALKTTIEEGDKIEVSKSVESRVWYFNGWNTNPSPPPALKFAYWKHEEVTTTTVNEWVGLTKAAAFAGAVAAADRSREAVEDNRVIKSYKLVETNVSVQVKTPVEVTPV